LSQTFDNLYSSYIQNILLLICLLGGLGHVVSEKLGTTSAALPSTALAAAFAQLPAT